MLLLHVDELVRLAGHVEQRLAHDLGPAQDLGGQAVEVGVGLVADELHAVTAAELVHDRFDDLGVGAVAHVGVGQDVLSHRFTSPCRDCVPVRRRWA